VIGVTDTLPTQDQIGEIRRILDAAGNRPILMYGVDRDQAAAAWALSRAESGVPAEIALQDGLTAGLRDRLPAVRERLGLGNAVPTMSHITIAVALIGAAVTIGLAIWHSQKGKTQGPAIIDNQHVSRGRA
jgi:hypothetical protein